MQLNEIQKDRLYEDLALRGGGVGCQARTVMGTRARAGMAVAVALVAMACGESHERGRGEPCELTSECDAPLVCRLGACRDECRGARDCPLGTICILDDEGGGVCQLAEEDGCALASDCPAPLVCAAAMCTNECLEDRDCAAGATCEVEAGAPGVCMESDFVPCVFTSDCPAPLVCAVDGVCRAECVADRDCASGSRCVDGACVPAT